MDALTSAYAMDFVSSLPNGLDSLIGERGVRLSMGEKQRITLACSFKIFSVIDFG